MHCHCSESPLSIQLLVSGSVSYSVQHELTDSSAQALRCQCTAQRGASACNGSNPSRAQPQGRQGRQCKRRGGCLVALCAHAHACACARACASALQKSRHRARPRGGYLEAPGRPGRCPPYPPPIPSATRGSTLFVFYCAAGLIVNIMRMLYTATVSSNGHDRTVRRISNLLHRQAHAVEQRKC